MNKAVMVILSLVCLGIYLFVSAPEKLEKSDQLSSDKRLSVDHLFEAVNAIGAHARHIYTSEIVMKGKKVGLKFGEDWVEKNVHQGPLPALFLRELSSELEKRYLPLGLYLGSDNPINVSNLFKGEALVNYRTVLETRQPYITNLEGYGSIAMFPDLASAKGCVTCHNEHPDSPKTDWKLNDVMGATTWTWPTETVSQSEINTAVNITLEALESAYTNYLKKTETFAEQPSIGEKWPSSGYYVLPSQDTYIDSVMDAAAKDVLTVMLQAEGI
jgi:hypothetical protein